MSFSSWWKPLLWPRRMDCVPIVYNSSGYDSVFCIQLLNEVVDIYMPDLKFLDAAAAARWTIAPDYPERACEAVRAMQASASATWSSTALTASPCEASLVRHISSSRHDGGQLCGAALSRRIRFAASLRQHHEPIPPVRPGAPIPRSTADFGTEEYRRAACSPVPGIGPR